MCLRSHLAALALLALGLPAPAGAQPLPPLDAEQTAGGYRAVLRLAAEGNRQNALTALAELEQRAVARRDAAAIDRLWRVKLGVIRELAPERIEILVPILHLHLEAGREYRERRLFGLSSHSRTMAVELAEAYVRRSAAADAPRVAGLALTALAGQGLEVQATQTAAAYLARALALDPRNPHALLALATIEEKVGQYEPAARRLGLLLEVEPGNAEARLRLALCLRRLGAVREAQPLLASLIDDEVDWIALVAAEELADLHADEGRDTEAVAVLRAAAARFPASQRILIRLSFMHERGRDPGAALGAAEQALASSGAEDSARLRYDRWPRGVFAAAEARLAEAARERLTLLAQALRAPLVVGG